MSTNCDNMVAIPSSTNQWTKVDDMDQKVLNMGGSSNNINNKKVMEKVCEEIVQQQQALKCPRCDSSNTKFCYYNNYSLSQPRHFCKACKRYWTRGGTLRNVPVGGGCRKNKRVKRPLTTNNNNSASASHSNNNSSSSSSAASQPQIDTVSTSNHIGINPLFYGLPCSASSDLNLPLFSRFGYRISSSGFDLQLNNDALGLGFSSGFGSNNTLLSSYSTNSNILGSGSSSESTTVSAMSSLLSSNLLQHKFVNCGSKDDGVDDNTFHQGLGLTPLDQLQIGSDSGEALKDVKVELGQSNNRFEWNNGACQNQIQHVGLYDPSLYWNNNNNTATTAFGVWNDQANNIGSSVTSLI